MEELFGEDWRKIYPEALTEREKAEIRSALLKNLQNGNHPLQDLLSYLKAIKRLNIYPTYY